MTIEEFKAKVIEALTVLSELHGKPLSKLYLRAYWMAVRDIDPDVFEKAVLELIRTSKFMPKPSEIRDKCGIGLDADLQRAWFQLNDALSKYGKFDRIQFVDPVLGQAVKSLGGLSALAQLPVSEFNRFTWHRFKEIYTALSESTISNQNVIFQTSRRSLGNSGGLLIVGDASCLPKLPSPSNQASQVVIKKP